jgi:cardiolipin synthase
VTQNLANALTVARLACALPVVLLLADGRYVPAFYVFLAAALSDIVDGFVAKRFSGCSPFGAALDPAADKILIASLFTALAIEGVTPFWFLGLIVARDLLLIGGAAILRWRIRGFRIEPLIIGKLCTFSQLLFGGFVLGNLAGIADVGWLLDPLLWAASGATLASAAVYLAMAVRLGTLPSLQS